MGTNFRLIGIFGVFHAFYYSRFERVSLFERLLDTLRIRALDVNKPTTSPDRCPANERDRSDSTALFLTPLFPPGVFRPSLLLGFLFAFFLAVIKQVHHSGIHGPASQRRTGKQSDSLTPWPRLSNISTTTAALIPA